MVNSCLSCFARLDVSQVSEAAQVFDPSFEVSFEADRRSVLENCKKGSKKCLTRSEGLT